MKCSLTTRPALLARYLIATTASGSERMLRGVRNRKDVDESATLVYIGPMISVQGRMTAIIGKPSPIIGKSTLMPQAVRHVTHDI